jgi:hypothetical protein
LPNIAACARKDRIGQSRAARDIDADAQSKVKKGQGKNTGKRLNLTKRNAFRNIMPPNLPAPFKAVALAALVAASAAVCAQGEDPWYNGQNSGFWGLGDSLGFRGSLPGMFGGPGTSPEGLSAQKQYGGYRFSHSIAIEGAQTSFGLNGSACGGDPLTGDAYRACYGAAWSLSGVATLPFKPLGLAFYGRLGLHYWQNGAQEEAANHRSPEDLGRIYGVGMSYELSKAVTLRAETERYTDLSGSNGNGAGSNLGLDASVHSIGLSIKF